MAISRKCDRCSSLVPTGLVVGNDPTNSVKAISIPPADAITAGGVQPSTPFDLSVTVLLDNDLCKVCFKRALVAYSNLV